MPLTPSKTETQGLSTCHNKTQRRLFLRSSSKFPTPIRRWFRTVSGRIGIGRTPSVVSDQIAWEEWVPAPAILAWLILNFTVHKLSSIWASNVVTYIHTFLPGASRTVDTHWIQLRIAGLTFTSIESTQGVWSAWVSMHHVNEIPTSQGASACLRFTGYRHSPVCVERFVMKRIHCYRYITFF